MSTRVSNVIDSRDPEVVELAFRAAEFRVELDTLLKKYEARLVIGWEGKWAIQQVQFGDNQTGKALTIAKVGRNGKTRYFTHADEIIAESNKRKTL